MSPVICSGFRETSGSTAVLRKVLWKQILNHPAAHEVSSYTLKALHLKSKYFRLASRSHILKSLDIFIWFLGIEQIKISNKRDGMDLFTKKDQTVFHNCILMVLDNLCILYVNLQHS